MTWLWSDDRPSPEGLCIPTELRRAVDETRRSKEQCGPFRVGFGLASSIALCRVTEKLCRRCGLRVFLRRIRAIAFVQSPLHARGVDRGYPCVSL